MSVTTKKENQFAYDGEVVRCHACAAQSRVAKKFIDEGGDSAGIQVRMTKEPDE